MKFNIDSPVFQFLGTLADFTLLNLVFLVSCIPVVTIGTAAVSYTHLAEGGTCSFTEHCPGGYLFPAYL